MDCAEHVLSAPIRLLPGVQAAATTGDRIVESGTRVSNAAAATGAAIDRAQRASAEISSVLEKLSLGRDPRPVKDVLVVNANADELDPVESRHPLVKGRADDELQAPVDHELRRRDVPLG